MTDVLVFLHHRQGQDALVGYTRLARISFGSWNAQVWSSQLTDLVHVSQQPRCRMWMCLKINICVPQKALHQTENVGIDCTDQPVNQLERRCGFVIDGPAPIAESRSILSYIKLLDYSLPDSGAYRVGRLARTISPLSTRTFTALRVWCRRCQCRYLERLSGWWVGRWRSFCRGQQLLDHVTQQGAQLVRVEERLRCCGSGTRWYGCRNCGRSGGLSAIFPHTSARRGRRRSTGPPSARARTGTSYRLDLP